MKQLSINGYEYPELTRKAKEQARINMEDYINGYYNAEADLIIDQFKEYLERQGYYDIQVFYSGFCSQGDGASFTATHPKGKVTRPFPWSYHYYHENTMDFEPYDYELSEIKINRILHNTKHMATRLYKQLSDMYDYVMSDEYISDICNSHFLYFNEAGYLIHS